MWFIHVNPPKGSELFFSGLFTFLKPYPHPTDSYDPSTAYHIAPTVSFLHINCSESHNRSIIPPKHLFQYSRQSYLIRPMYIIIRSRTRHMFIKLRSQMMVRMVWMMLKQQEKVRVSIFMGRESTLLSSVWENGGYYIVYWRNGELVEQSACLG